MYKYIFNNIYRCEILHFDACPQSHLLTATTPVGDHSATKSGAAKVFVFSTTSQPAIYGCLRLNGHSSEEVAMRSSGAMIFGVGPIMGVLTWVKHSHSGRRGEWRRGGSDMLGSCEDVLSTTYNVEVWEWRVRYT